MKKYLILFLFLTFWPASIRAEVKEVYATYSYAVGDNETKVQARRACLNEAKRLALEQAGSYLESYTEVVNYQLAQDRIFSFSAGILETQIVKEEIEFSQNIPIITLKIRARIDTGLLTQLINKFRFKNYENVLFEQVYSDQDADQYGRIRTFTWGEHGERAGDTLEITGHIPPGVPEIKIWRGKTFSPKWHTTRDGYFRAAIEHIEPGKFFGIWLEKEKEITALVRIVRGFRPPD